MPCLFHRHSTRKNFDTNTRRSLQIRLVSRCKMKGPVCQASRRPIIRQHDSDVMQQFSSRSAQPSTQIESWTTYGCLNHRHRQDSLTRYHPSSERHLRTACNFIPTNVCFEACRCQVFKRLISRMFTVVVASIDNHSARSKRSSSRTLSSSSHQAKAIIHLRPSSFT